MREDVRDALMIDPSTPMEDRTIDITTTGRRTGEPRRLETVFYRFGDRIYLSGLPAPRPRAWLLNLTAQPQFLFHLKGRIWADLPAVATVIDDPEVRRQVLTQFVAEFNERHGPGSQWPEAVLDEWVQNSPLVEVAFPDAY